MPVAEVILDVSCEKVLDYEIPESLQDKVKRGIRVSVPVRGHLRKGYVVGLKAHSEYAQLKAIHETLSQSELLNEDTFELALWMSQYYGCSMQKTLRCILPAPVRQDTSIKTQLFVKRALSREKLAEHCRDLRNKSPAQALFLDGLLKVKKGILLSELLEQTRVSRGVASTLEKKGLIILENMQIDRSPLLKHEFFPTAPKTLNSCQQEAFDNIAASLDHHLFKTHLLYGITGSGKTEVYLQLIEKALKQHKGVIVLVPEIALTTQTIERFKSRLNVDMAILHHRLSQGERYDQWMKILKGEIPLVIGARSAIFSPVKNLGLIIVDEEHERSYKQTDESPCYHARDIAVVRAKLSQACAVLGSATPALESYYNAKRGRYALDLLSQRADEASIPKVTILDMKQEKGKTPHPLFSQYLLDSLAQNFQKGYQSLIFLNRRGYFTLMKCQACEEVVKCPNCELSLTFHRGENLLSCHQCNFLITPPPAACPSCKQNATMKFRGVGTEQVERALQALFPDMRFLRMDADTTRHKGSHDQLIKAFRTHKADVLIGTQMIAKGLHFPQVTLACVLNCDSALNIPDFRASEHAFQLLTQVAGRAGRGKLKGEVIFQSFIPENPTIKLAATQDFSQFYDQEIQVRELFNYPPFCQMVKLIFSGKQANEVEAYARDFRQKLLPLLDARFQLHPVTPPAHAKINEVYRFHCLIRGPNISFVTQQLQTLIERFPVPGRVKLLVDVNPTSTFF